MWKPAARVYFLVCLALARLLRAATYSRARVVCRGGELQVYKRRLFYAPLLVWMGGAVVWLLDTGVRVLPQRDWEERERSVYRSLHGASIRVEAGGTLALPRLRGETLAGLLEDAELEEPMRKAGIEHAVVALAALHRRGLTHADAMADNVLVDLETCGAYWFDFETVHDERRPMPWRRADDLRALLATCLARVAPQDRATTLQAVLDAYPDEEVVALLPASFASVWRRSLTFHLAQAGLSFECFGQVARLLGERIRDPGC